MAKAPYTADFAQRKPDRSIEEAMSEVQRELQVRERCFARWVGDGKMTAVEARDRFARLESAWLYLDRTNTLQSEDSPAPEKARKKSSQEEP